MTGDEPVGIRNLATQIGEHLRPPSIDLEAVFERLKRLKPESLELARPGLPLAARREWQERFKASAAAETNVIAFNRPKPRIRVRVRAATPHTA